MTGSVKDGNGAWRGRRRAAVRADLCRVAPTVLAGMSLPSLPKLDDINPFAEKPVPLPGKRISVIQQENIGTDLAAADKPIMLPPQQQSDAWTSQAASPTTRRATWRSVAPSRAHGAPTPAEARRFSAS